MAPSPVFVSLSSLSALTPPHHLNDNPGVTSSVQQHNYCTDYSSHSPLISEELSVREAARQELRDRAGAERALLCTVASDGTNKPKDVAASDPESISFSPFSRPSFDADADETIRTVVNEVTDGLPSGTMESESSSTSSDSMNSLSADTTSKGCSSSVSVDYAGNKEVSNFLSRSVPSFRNDKGLSEKSEPVSSSLPNQCPVPFVSSRSRSISKPSSRIPCSPVSPSDVVTTSQSISSSQSYPSSQLMPQRSVPEPEGFTLVNNRRRRSLKTNEYIPRTLRFPCPSETVFRRDTYFVPASSRSVTTPTVEGAERKLEGKETYLSVATKAAQVNICADVPNNEYVPAAMRPREISCFLSDSSLPPNTRPSGQQLQSPKRQLVVVDGQNVGWNYGKNTKFSALGVQIALDYFRFNDFQALAILPRSLVDDRFPQHNTKLADDPAILRRLEEEERVFFTAANTHDDFTMLEFAMQRQADLVSNDKFRAEYGLQERGNRAFFRRFLDEHLIPFSFILGEFVPHPNPNWLGRSMHHKRIPARGHHAQHINSSIF